MKNKALKILLILLILIIIIIGVLFFIFKISKKDSTNFSFDLNSDSKYKIITNMRFLTMRNDGGSNTDIYYCVDFDKNTVTKINDDYIANLGGTSERTVTIVYEKTFSNEFKETLKTYLDKIIVEEDVNDSKNYLFFTIESLNVEKDIYNENTIKELNNMLKQIDEM